MVLAIIGSPEQLSCDYADAAARAASDFGAGSFTAPHHEYFEQSVKLEFWPSFCPLIELSGPLNYRFRAIKLFGEPVRDAIANVSLGVYIVFPDNVVKYTRAQWHWEFPVCSPSGLGLICPVEVGAEPSYGTFYNLTDFFDKVGSFRKILPFLTVDLFYARNYTTVNKTS
jgi:heme/copper-type cytochrome/quinol oxidase subunit 2